MLSSTYLLAVRRVVVQPAPAPKSHAQSESSKHPVPSYILPPAPHLHHRTLFLSSLPYFAHTIPAYNQETPRICHPTTSTSTSTTLTSTSTRHHRPGALQTPRPSFARRTTARTAALSHFHSRSLLRPLAAAARDSNETFRPASALHQAIPDSTTRTLFVRHQASSPVRSTTATPPPTGTYSHHHRNYSILLPRPARSILVHFWRRLFFRRPTGR